MDQVDREQPDGAAHESKCVHRLAAGGRGQLWKRERDDEAGDGTGRGGSRGGGDVGVPPVRGVRLSHFVAGAAGDFVDGRHADAIDGFGRSDRDVAEVEITLDLGCVALMGIAKAAAAR